MWEHPGVEHHISDPEGKSWRWLDRLTAGSCDYREGSGISDGVELGKETQGAARGKLWTCTGSEGLSLLSSDTAVVTYACSRKLGKWRTYFLPVLSALILGLKGNVTFLTR